MKKRSTLLKLTILILFTNFTFSQSNQYPTIGDVIIRNYSPNLVLQRSEEIGGFTAGIQTRMFDGTENWYFGSLNTDSWIVSKGSYQHPKLTVLSNGNVGIGTQNPSNIQGWDNVLDVAGMHHSKILATSENSLYRVGIFSHNEEWYGGGGFVGTESNHPLHLITNYSAKMSILTNGNVGIGTTLPETLLNVNVGAGGSNGIAGIRVGGLSNYASLELGIDGDYDGMIRSFGNNINYYAGHWKAKGTIASENHSHNWYTSKNGSTDWSLIKMILNENGNLGIGTTNPDERLTVKGKIHTQEVRVDMAGPLVPDYVFTENYKLKSLQEVEDYIKENKHLPEIPSAKEIEKNGLMLAEMNMSLLKKMEEMTLYMIEQNKRMNNLEKENQYLKNEVSVIKNKIKK